MSHKEYCFGKGLKSDLFEEFLVDEVEGVEVGTIDIQDGDDGAVFAYRNNYLAVRSRGTSDVSGELVDIRHNEGAVLRPSGATDAAVIGDTGASDGALEGTKNQFAGADDIEAGPEEVESRMEDGDDVGHIGDEVGFACNERLYLREDGLVEGFLDLAFLRKDVKHFSSFKFVVKVGISIGIKGEKLLFSALFGGFIFRKALLPLRCEGDIFSSR